MFMFRRKKHERRATTTPTTQKNSNIPHHTSIQKQKEINYSSSSVGTCAVTAGPSTSEPEPQPPEPLEPRYPLPILPFQQQQQQQQQQKPSSVVDVVGENLVSTKSMMSITSRVSCTKSTPRASGRQKHRNQNTTPMANVSANSSSMSKSVSRSASRSASTCPSTANPSPVSSTGTTRNVNELSESSTLPSSPQASPSSKLAIPRLSRNLPPFPYSNNSTSISNHSQGTSGQSLASASGIHNISPSASGSLSPSSTINYATPSSPYDYGYDQYGHGHPSSHETSIHEPSQNNPARLKWNVQDSKLKPIPSPLHPPIPKHQTTFVDASPSIVASRIDACLKKRSLVAEFDEDAAVATVFTRERGCFVIQLYRGGRLKNWNANANANANVASPTINRGGTPNHANAILNDLRSDSFTSMQSPSKQEELNSPQTLRSTTSALSRSEISESSQGTGIPTITPDFSHGVIVECVRIRGDTIAFHRHCAAVLSSARGDSDGLDDFRSEKVSLIHTPYGFGCKKSRATKGRAHQSLSTKEIYAMETDAVPNLIQLEKKTYSDLNSTASTFAELEQCLQMLEKDRIDVNLLGIQSLVLLTDQGVSGIENAFIASLSVLRSRKDSKSGKSSSRSIGSCSTDGDGQHLHHRSLVRLHEKVLALLIGKFTCPKRFISLDDDSSDDEDISMGAEEASSRDSDVIVAEYNVTIRSYALQALTNALTNVIYHSEDFPLMLPRPTCEEYMTIEFMQKIAEDLAGATRPPMASLGSAHEATLASRFFHLLAAYSERGYHVTNDAMIGSPPRPIQGLLQRANDAGAVSHRALELETQVALTALGGKS